MAVIVVNELTKKNDQGEDIDVDFGGDGQGTTYVMKFFK